MFKRALSLTLPVGQSVFLWGARQTGKSTYLKNHFPKSLYIDLLKSEEFISLNKQPSLLRERINALSQKELSNRVIIDEIQKIPALMDEVHWLIENTNAYFILCGSSARKLKRSGINLLGGRAWKYHFYPLTYQEISEFDVLKALNTGLIPSHYLSQCSEKSLQAYVEDYLMQEIKEEGLVRNLPSFIRFLDSVAFTNGEMVNYTNIASDCGVDAKTVQNYFEILVDTLLGYYLLPYRKQISRRILREKPKFYLFDIGVANYLSKHVTQSLRGFEAGKTFEHFIFMELVAYKGIKNKRFELTYWRTNSGLEVDFILGSGEVAIEVKISDQVRTRDIKGLIAFCEEHSPKKAMVVIQDLHPRKINVKDNVEIEILPWKKFLTLLWTDKLV